MKTTLRDIAATTGFELIQSVHLSADGTPSSIKDGLIGFIDYEEVQDYARKLGFTIALFHKKADWEAYVRSYDVTGPLRITAVDYGGGYKSFTNKITQEQYIEQAVLPDLPSTSFDDITTFLGWHQEVFDKILEAKDDELVIVDFIGRYVDTIKEKSVRWSHNGHTWAIGLVES